jgi:C-terminal processing protease CtpA/Prc
VKKIVLLIISVSFLSITQAQSNQKLENLKTFAKAYGYVKYFHPSDEAAHIDWNSFAIYGAEQIEKCSSQQEVITTLNQLFHPIAPTVVFSNSKTGFDFKTITPPNVKKYKPIYWQHNGLGIGMNNNGGTYSSVRVNSKDKVVKSSGFGNIMTGIDADKYLGKEIKYTGFVKMKEGSSGTGHLWLRVDNKDKSMGFFNNMGNDPIKSSEWKQYEIIGNVDSNSTSIVFGCFLQGKGALYFDKAQFFYKQNEEWIELPLKNNGFETGGIVDKWEDDKWVGRGAGYDMGLTSTTTYEGNKSAVIAYMQKKTANTSNKKLFDHHPNTKELIEEEIGGSIFCQIPISLYINKNGTYPEADSKRLSSLEKSLSDINTTDNNLSLRLGNIINIYNVFQHFYPYFDVVGVNWEKEFEIALKSAYNNTEPYDYWVTLKKFTAKLKDGHIRVNKSPNKNIYLPPFKWEWVENKLIITEVFDDNLSLQIGDIITKIDNQDAKEYFQEINSRISAGTKGWIETRATTESLLGEKDSEITVATGNNIINIKRNLTRQEYFKQEHQKPAYSQLDNNIYYLNLDAIEMDTINKLLPQLEKCSAIICDLRGYPNGNHDFISYLLEKDDTSKSWMRIPQIIYPDQKNITSYQNEGWGLKAKKPYLGDKKIVFIIDGSAISYAESYMSFIEGYKLATIIGQPTAGTNGNVNPFRLHGGYSIYWTGMKVIKHDGSQHHGVGILPNIYVNKTIEGIKAGKDEFLEKAIEFINAN